MRVLCVCICMYLYLCLCVCLFVFMFMYVYGCLSVCLSVRLSVCLSVCMSVYMSVCRGDTAVYLMFAYARIASILRKAKEEHGVDICTFYRSRATNMK